MDVAGVLGKVFGKAVDDKLSTAQDQSTEEKKLVAFVRERVEEVRMTPARVAHEATWMVNTAYLLGYDQVYFDVNSRQFRSLSANNQPITKARVHVNTIMPTIQNRLARLCKSPPRYEVKPNSPKTEDKDAARLSLDVLVQLWDKVKLDQKRIPLFMWIQQCGYAFVKISWDPQIGASISSPMTGETDYEGDIRADVISAFEIFCDPLCRDDFEDAQWLIHARVRKLDYFRTNYPDRGYLVKEEDAWLLSIQYENRINSVTPQAPFSGSQSYQMKNAAIELAYYEKRSRKFPNGRMVITSNGVLLEDKDLPIDEIPFSKFDDIIIGGKFDSEAMITHLRPLNDQFNRVVSKRADFFNRMMAGKYISPRGSKLAQEAINDDNAEVVEYNHKPGQPEPSVFPMPQMPAYAYKETDEFKAMHYDISGIGEISRGQLPAAGIPAIGMQFLQEQDDSRLGIETESHEHSWARVGRHILKFVNNYYQTNRLLKMSGQNQGYVIKEFKGEDLKGHFDIIVIKGSTLPGSKILRRQELLNAYDRGLLGDPADPKVREKILGMLEYGETSEIWEDYSLDQKMLRENISLIEAGQAPNTSEFDNHDALILGYNRYRKSDKFNMLTPEQKMILLGVMEWHIQALIRIQNPDIAAGQKLDMQSQLVKNQIMQDPAKYTDVLNSLDQMPPSPQGPMQEQQLTQNMMSQPQV